MIVRLWALAWAARYLKYVPILGWRFSENIVQRIEDRMDRDVEIEDVDLDVDADAPPTDVVVEVRLANELPVDLSVTAVNVRLGYAEDADTVANVAWTDDSHGSEPRNVETAFVESDDTGTVSVERYLPATIDAIDPSNASADEVSSSNASADERESSTDDEASSGTGAGTSPDALHVDGTLTTTAWLDVPSTRRIPLGDIECELPDASTAFASEADDHATADADADDEEAAEDESDADAGEEQADDDAADDVDDDADDEGSAHLRDLSSPRS